MVRLHADVPYFGYEKNLRLENGEVDLVIPTEFGPRITRYGFVGRQNLFAEIPAAGQRVETPYGDDWHIYGGHRLWYAPETSPGSYHPDNRPVLVRELPRGVQLTQEVESHSGLEKSITIELAEQGSEVTLRHRLENRGATTHELAPWALSAMAPGGRALFPHVPFAPHPDVLAPARSLVLWPFTKMQDPRWSWGDRYLGLRQDPRRSEPQKVGLYDPIGHMVYALDGQLFVKLHEPRPGPHADHGCNVETFTNELFLELETLGPLVTLLPGESVEHLEQWRLFDGITLPEDEASVERTLSALLGR